MNDLSRADAIVAGAGQRHQQHQPGHPPRERSSITQAYIDGLWSQARQYRRRNQLGHQWSVTHMNQIWLYLRTLWKCVEDAISAILRKLIDAFENSLRHSVYQPWVIFLKQFIHQLLSLRLFHSLLYLFWHNFQSVACANMVIRRRKLLKPMHFKPMPNSFLEKYLTWTKFIISIICIFKTHSISADKLISQ